MSETRWSFHGTGDVADNPVSVSIIESMASRGFVAASVPYDSLSGIGQVLDDPSQACQVLHEKADCLFGSGEGSAITKICARPNADCSRDGLIARVSARVEAFGERGGIVLTDVAGGSCTQAALVVAATHAKGPVYVVSGVNLPMLLDFLHNRAGAEPRALADRLVARGHASISVVAAPQGAGGPKA